MSALTRLASGSAAAWARIAVTLCAQIAFVPLYLSFWNPETYGVWLGLNALLGLTTIIGVGYQNFLGYEFLRIGAENRLQIRQLLYSTIPIVLFVALFELVLVVGGVALGVQNWILGAAHIDDKQLLRDVGIVLIAHAVVWLFVSSAGGIVGRVLTPFGHYPRMAWWGVFAGIVTSCAPAIAVASSASLLYAGIASAAAIVLYNIPVFAVMGRLLMQERLILMRPDIALGARYFMRSLALTIKTFLEMAHQQGVRLILSALAGASEMAAFATMRTGANVCVQGLGTITSPLMPELMRFLNDKDQSRSEAAYGFIWLALVGAMAPTVILFQWLAPFLFDIWTRGKIDFDPLLFAMLSLGALVYALAQPAVSIVQGNNLLRPQLQLSTLSLAIVAGGLLVFVPQMGIRGAALALLVAEFVSMAGYTIVAARWLRGQSMHWPLHAFATVCVAVLTAGASMGAIALAPELGAAIAGLGLLMEIGVLVLYWGQLPRLARSRAAGLIARCPPEVLTRHLARRLG